eukprot:9506906-Heterocapsa_arctica.AAC.1
MIVESLREMRGAHGEPPRLEDGLVLPALDADRTAVDVNEGQLQLSDHPLHSRLLPSDAVPPPLEADAANLRQDGLR